MHICNLEILNFRGVQHGAVRFYPHTVFVGPNNSGKTTIIEALALLFGRDRMVRQLTEHDFYGSDPQPVDRIRLIATVIGFDGDDPSDHSDWFRDDRGIVKWWSPTNGSVHATRDDPTWKLACQVAFSARFHRPSLEVETHRYFYDDGAVGDVFTEENVQPLPNKLIRDIGFFLVPANRTWDRTVSFGSELFRRVVASANGQPSESVLHERDRLRDPQQKLEQDEHLAPIVGRLNAELKGFFQTAPTIHLRVTPTDSEGLLEAVMPHYKHEGANLALPARRHGSGLLSLQHLLLLLEFGRLRSEASEGFWMALEEPELHVPPSLQRRLVHRLQALSSQTFISTHSPTIAALADPGSLMIFRNENGVLSSTPLLSSPLPANSVNGVRKLFQLNRVETVSALMHEIVLVPEGRTDYELLRLLARAVDLHQGWHSAEECRFDSSVGIVPTHDAAVMATADTLAPLHPKIVALVDGDAEGIGYTQSMRNHNAPNSGVILRWGDDQTVEDVIGWVVSANEQACLSLMTLDPPPESAATLAARLKSKDREAHGLKQDSAAYEIVVDAIGAVDACRARAVLLLNGIVDASSAATLLFQDDQDAPGVRVFHP